MNLKESKEGYMGRFEEGMKRKKERKLCIIVSKIKERHFLTQNFKGVTLKKLLFFGKGVTFLWKKRKTLFLAQVSHDMTDTERKKH